ncbi:MAG: hypothetical protein Q4Q03_02025, partial [Bowdeniella nasicola]|nr:hypothetical protein [Bowdeniella nasicola]
APQGSTYVTYGDDVRVTVEPASAGSQAAIDDRVSFARSYTPELEAAVQADINAYISQCFSSPHFEPSGCPNTL